MIIKYCGITSLEDLQIVSPSTANLLGFIFAKSKREVTPQEVAGWIQKVSIKKKQLVGVFVNASLMEIDQVLKHVPLDIIQCHGTESVEQLKKIKSEFSIPVWKAIHHSANSIEKILSLGDVVDGYVIDTKVEGAWGGTGVAFDWKVIPDYARTFSELNLPYLIAGGITPDNIEELLTYNPLGLDVSSGIEENGKKSLNKINLMAERIGKYDVSR
ncbi:phosphoribosylanthranilate isomerase [Bacillus timonensis]|nr:phosphoribosylanthranilate isomerase [Bacillus timonensis]